MNNPTKLALVAALGVALLGITARAQSDNADPAPGPPPGGPPPGPPRLEHLLQQLLDRYDTNKDGGLDQNELAALRQDIADGKIQLPPPPGAPGPHGPGGPWLERLPKEILDKYDVNKDGKLDETERAALRQDIADGKIQLPPPPGPGPAGLGHPGFHPLTAKEIIEKYDTDKDGKLDETELAAFLKDMHQHRPPPGPHAPMGGPPPGDPPPGGPPPQDAPQH